jgi:hypothetical protein
VIITHGRAKRRMIGFALGVGAASARARMPELIAETFQRAPKSRADAAAVAGRPPAMPRRRAGRAAGSDQAR